MSDRVGRAIVIVAALVVTHAFGACIVTEQKGTQTQEVVLENEHLRIVVCPELGGSCSSAFLKAAKTELTRDPKYGVLEDRRWSELGYERMRQYPYVCRVLSRGPDEAAIELSAKCRVPGFTELSVTKALRLKKGRSDLQVRYRFHNGSKTTLPLGWWFFSDLGVAGKANVCHAPTPQGVARAVIHHPGEQVTELFGQTNDRFLYDLPRGWGANIAAGKVGVAATFDVRHASCFYNFGGSVKTFEWIFNETPLEPGKTFETSFHIIPVTDLPTADGAGRDLVGSLITPGKEWSLTKPAQFAGGYKVPISVAVAGSSAETVRIVTDTRLLPKGDWQRLDERALQLQPVAASKFSLSYLPEADGTHVLRCRISRGDQLVFDMERPFVYRTPSAAYALKPDHTKIGKELKKYRPKKAPATPRRTVLYLDEDYQPSREVATPHVKWAVPWAAGKVRILIPIHHRIMRQVVELAQRADIDYDCVAMDTFKGDLSPAEAHLLGQKIMAAKYDVLVIGGSDLARLPEKLKQAALARAREDGKGIVCYGHEIRRCVLPKTLKTVTDAFLTAGLLPDCRHPVLYEYGKGRVAAMPYRYNYKGGLLCPNKLRHGAYLKQLFEAFSEDFGFTEHYYAMAARAIFWAAGRAPAAGIRLAAKPSRAGQPGGTVIASIQNALDQPASGALLLRLSDRYSDTAVIPPREVRIPVGKSTHEFKLDPLPAGRYAADAWLREEDGTIMNWATTSFLVEGEVEFSEMAFDRDLYAESGALRLHVKLKLDPKADEPVYVRWEMHGNVGGNRLLGQGREGAEQEEEGIGVCTINTKIVRPLERYRQFRLYAEQDGVRVAQTRTGCYVKPMPRPAQFHAIGYGRMDRELHSNTRFGYGERSMPSTQQGWDLFAWYFLAKNFRIQRGEGGSVRPGCLTDPAFREQCKPHVDHFSQFGRLQGNLGLLVADEWGYGGEGNVPSDFCHSPTCLAGFRAFLKKEHQTLDALNRSWRSAYKAWDEIVPPTSAGTRKSGHWERWIDHRRYVETVVADFFGFLLEHGRTIYPEASFGFSGTPNAGSYNGYDWAKLLKNMNALSCYGGPQLQIVRSLKRPDMFFVRWAGYDRLSKNEKAHRSAPWFALLNDMDGLAYYVSSYSPLCKPDGTRFPKATWIEEEWRDLRAGLAALLRNARRSRAPVAIHYSQSSMHCATSQGRYDQYNNVLSSTMALLSDLGCLSDFVAYDGVEGGKLAPYPVFFMPYSQAVSRREAEQIAAFVRNGGTVVADVFPAVRDEHGHPAQSGMLDEVFGVQCDPADMPSFKSTMVNGDGLPEDIQLLAGQTKLRVSGAKALARLPGLDNALAWVVNRYGKGRAILLNFTFAGYSGYAAGGLGGEIDIVKKAKEAARLAVGAIGSRLLAQVRVRPPVTITTADGKPFSEALVVPFTQGEATYVGVLPGRGQGYRIDPKRDTTAATVDFVNAHHVYEVRGHKYYGETKSVSTDLVCSKAKLFALMPSALNPIRTRFARKPSREQGAQLILQAEDIGVDRVAHIEVTGPDGKPCRLYTRDVIVRAGKGEWTVPLALNDPAGEWRISVSGTVDGKETTLRFRLP